MTNLCLLLLLFSSPSSLTPLSQNEVDLRLVALTESDPDLLRAALLASQPDLLRIALTDANPDLLKVALTDSKPNLLKAALSGDIKSVIPELSASLNLDSTSLLRLVLTGVDAQTLKGALTTNVVVEVRTVFSTEL